MQTKEGGKTQGGFNLVKKKTLYRLRNNGMDFFLIILLIAISFIDYRLQLPNHSNLKTEKTNIASVSRSANDNKDLANELSNNNVNVDSIEAQNNNNSTAGSNSNANANENVNSNTNQDSTKRVIRRPVYKPAPAPRVIKKPVPVKPAPKHSSNSSKSKVKKASANLGTCRHKHDHPRNSKTKGRHMDEDCCMDPDETKNPRCKY